LAVPLKSTSLNVDGDATSGSLLSR